MIPLVPLALMIGAGAAGYCYKKYQAELHKYVQKQFSEYMENHILGNKKNSVEYPCDDPDKIRVNGEPLLIYAIREMGAYFVHTLLRMHADVNIRSTDGDTPLIIAVRNDDRLDVQRLISAGADVNAMNRDGKTALFYAGSEICINYLAQAGAYFNAQDEEGKTALFFTNSETLARCMILRGTNPELRDQNGDKAPILAGMLNVKNNNTSFEELTADSQEMLRMAVIRNDVQTVEYMVANVVKPDFMVDDGTPDIGYDDVSALRYALKKNYSEMAQVLIRAGASLLDDDIHSMIYLAIDNNDAEVIKLMIRAGMTPAGCLLTYAIQHGKTEAASCLIPYVKHDFIYYDQRFVQERNVLEVAVMNKNTQIVKELLENGANIHTHIEVENMLEYAYKNDCFEIAHMLMHAGMTL